MAASCAEKKARNAKATDFRDGVLMVIMLNGVARWDTLVAKIGKNACRKGLSVHGRGDFRFQPTEPFLAASRSSGLRRSIA